MYAKKIQRLPTITGEMIDTGHRLARKERAAAFKELVLSVGRVFSRPFRLAASESRHDTRGAQAKVQQTN